jgi:trehalose 6-phosphate synthase/phosphatase
LQELTEQFSGRKIIIGIDRLDYIKGIPHKLYAMERFFQNNPEWVGKVVMVQIAIPSRTDVKEYQRLARETHEIVGRINGRFGSLSKVPIHYLDQTIPFARMCALYRIADVCINTSLRDGMNLVSYEYVACQQENSGVLILSEFAGAAQSLGAGCLRVNPWDIDEVANAIQEALTMSDDERKLYQNYCFKYIEEHTAQVWAESFVSSLERCTISNSKSIIPPKLSFESVCDKFSRSSGHRLIILGLVGTITQKRKEGLDYETYSRVIKINPEIAKSLSTLSNSKRTSIVIITSRGKDVCEKACSGCGAWVAAENGYFLQNPGSSVWEEFYGACDLDWMDEVEEVFNYFCDRTPKSFIEREQTSITWHYKDCDAEFSELQARDLLIHLKSGPLINTATEVVHSNKLVQVRPSGVSKGHTVEKLIQRIHSSDPVGFILCLGNFLGRDEDVFVTLEGKSLVEMSRSPRRVTEYLSDEVEVVSVTIGARSTAAKNYIRTIADVQNLLFFLCQVCEAEGSISSQLTKSISAPALNIRIPRTASLPDILEISKNSQIMDHQADSYT